MRSYCFQQLTEFLSGGDARAQKILEMTCRLLGSLSDIQCRDPSTIAYEVTVMKHPMQSKEVPRGGTRQRAFVAHVPKAAAMLLFGTPTRPMDPEITLMEDTLCCAGENAAGVPIMLIEP